MAGRWPKIEEAPDPSLITWANLGKGKIERCFRGTISNILALVLLLVGFFMIVYLIALQAKYKLDIDACGELEIDEDIAFENWLKFRKYNDPLNTCYCLQELKADPDNFKDKTFPDGNFACKLWF